ncbi:MFS transporter [Streptomyces gelaticus]|uniref:MFS transporter n=1 Tax=Streptomyces gelaticus TaxID=285446 RepID=UPI003570AE9F
MDRVGPRAASWTAHLASALHALDLLSFPVLLALVALIGTARGPGDPANEVTVPEPAERGRVPLERAAGLSGVSERLASTVGLAVGGSLVALLGPLTTLTVNSGCFALGSLIIKLVLPRGRGTRPRKPPRRPRRRAPATGSGSARTSPSCATSRCCSPSSSWSASPSCWTQRSPRCPYPSGARESGNGPTVIGLMGSVMGAAAVGGSLIAAVVAHRLQRRIVVLTGSCRPGHRGSWSSPSTPRWG